MISVNGEASAEADGLTLGVYLAKADYPISRIAVEYNGVIVPKANYKETLLRDGDVLEIVHFVGGG